MQISIWDKSIDQTSDISPCTQILWFRKKFNKLEMHTHAHSSDAYKKLLMNIQEFVNNCYQDMIDFENHELYTHDKKEAMEYIIRCLANPLCNGSFSALEAINRQRFNIDLKNNYDCDDCRYDCWKNNKCVRDYAK